MVKSIYLKVDLNNWSYFLRLLDRKFQFWFMESICVHRYRARKAHPQLCNRNIWHWIIVFFGFVTGEGKTLLYISIQLFIDEKFAFNQTFQFIISVREYCKLGKFRFVKNYPKLQYSLTKKSGYKPINQSYSIILFQKYVQSIIDKFLAYFTWVFLRYNAFHIYSFQHFLLIMVSHRNKKYPTMRNWGSYKRVGFLSYKYDTLLRMASKWCFCI